MRITRPLSSGCTPASRRKIFGPRTHSSRPCGSSGTVAPRWSNGLCSNVLSAKDCLLLLSMQLADDVVDRRFVGIAVDAIPRRRPGLVERDVGPLRAVVDVHVLNDERLLLTAARLGC